MRLTIFALVLILSAMVSRAENATIRVEGMSCGGCAAGVVSALKQIDGVSEARVSYERGQAVVTYDSGKITPEAIARAAELRLPGYKLVVGGAPLNPSESPKACAPRAGRVASPVQTNKLDFDRVTFYEIGLVCPAAPKIGCGSRSKPVLLSLLTDRRIAGAWLNKAGTRLAIAWNSSKEIPPPEHLNQILADQGVAVNQVSLDDHPELIASFRSHDGWFDAASVDRLSEEEAGIIAARLVRRLAAKTTITPTQDTALRNAIEQAFRKRFIDNEGGDLEAELLAVAQEARLDPKALAALREVVALGYRPLPNEE